MKRRHFLKKSAAALAASAWTLSSARAVAGRGARYRLALGQWTFNRAFRGVEVEYEGPGHSPGAPKAERRPGKPLSETEGCIATMRLLQKHLGSDLGTQQNSR